MDPMQRIEQALSAALSATEAPSAPPRLAAAVRHAVFPGGARVRPRLCVAVALACGDDDPALTDAAAPVATKAVASSAPAATPRPTN